MNTPQCLQSIHHNTIHHNSSQYYVKSTCAHKKTQKGWHGLKMCDNVWQCLTVSECAPPSLTWFAQPSTLILCRRHHWWSRTFCCPIASDICINSAGVDTSRETLHPQCQGESVTCDPKSAGRCLNGILMSFDELSLRYEHESTWTWKKRNIIDHVQSTVYNQHHNACIMPLLWSPTESALQSQNLAFSDDSLVSRRIHYRTHSRIHTGLCDSACLQRWCRCKFRSQRCRMHLRKTQRTLNQATLTKTSSKNQRLDMAWLRSIQYNCIVTHAFKRITA